MRILTLPVYIKVQLHIKIDEYANEMKIAEISIVFTVEDFRPVCFGQTQLTNLQKITCPKLLGRCVFSASARLARREYNLIILRCHE